MRAPIPDLESVTGVWRLCQHLLGDADAATSAARAALRDGDDRVANVLSTCRAALAGAAPSADPAVHARRSALSLPPADGEATVLHIVEGLPLPAVAAALGIPRRLATVRVRAGLARLGPLAVAALRVTPKASLPLPTGLRPVRRRREGIAAALVASLALIALAPVSVRTQLPDTTTLAARASEPAIYGLSVGEPPVGMADDANAIDIQAWIFEGERDAFAVAGIDCGAPDQCLPLTALARLQHAAAGRSLAMHAFPVGATGADGHAYVGSYRSVTLIHGERPDLPATTAQLGAVLDGRLVADGAEIAITDLVAQHARLIGSSAPGGAQVDIDRTAVSVVLHRGSLGAARLRADQVLVLPLPTTVQRPPAVAPAGLDAEPRLAPHTLAGEPHAAAIAVADHGETSGNEAALVVKLTQRALYFEVEPTLAPSSLSRR